LVVVFTPLIISSGRSPARPRLDNPKYGGIRSATFVGGGSAVSVPCDHGFGWYITDFLLGSKEWLVGVIESKEGEMKIEEVSP